MAPIRREEREKGQMREDKEQRQEREEREKGRIYGRTDRTQGRKSPISACMCTPARPCLT